MGWVRLDDSFPDHPKALQAGPLACWLYVCGIAYANRYLTDGFVPERQVRRLTDSRKPEALVRALLDAELWESVEGGYQIHDYLEYQPSADKVREDRAKNAARQDKWRDNQRVSNASSNGVTNGLVTPAPITTQVTNLSVGADAPSSGLKALPRNGPAQTLVATWYERAGGQPVNYKKAVGLGQKLANLGATERDVGELYEWMSNKDFFDGEFDLGTAVSQYEKFQQSRKPRKRSVPQYPVA